MTVALVALPGHCCGTTEHAPAQAFGLARLLWGLLDAGIVESRQEALAPNYAYHRWVKYQGIFAAPQLLGCRKSRKTFAISTYGIRGKMLVVFVSRVVMPLVLEACSHLEPYNTQELEFTLRIMRHISNEASLRMSGQ